MGWSLGGVRFRRNGLPTRVHADGNNAAWTCAQVGCGHPVLFTYQNGKAGSAPGNPAHCLGCNAQYWLSPAFGARPEPPRGDIQQPAPAMDIV